MAQLLTLTAYARRRGASYSSVRGKIYAGTIAAAVKYSETGKMLGIDGDEADALWRAHTDPALAARARAGQHEDGAFKRARSMRARVNAQIAQIELEQKLGRLVDTAQATSEFRAVLTQVRDALVGAFQSGSRLLSTNLQNVQIRSAFEKACVELLGSIDQEIERLSAKRATRKPTTDKRRRRSTAR